jgi:superfamily II DNA helicase RecQ
MVYLTATLPPHDETEFMNIMRIKADDVHMFRAPTSRPNITYSVVEYEEDEFGRGDIAAVCRLVEEKLEEYVAPAKIIIYSSSIVTTQEVSNALDCHAYYRDVGDAAVKDEIRKAWESADGRVVVATNAFGLGIDRPVVTIVALDNRFVRNGRRSEKGIGSLGRSRGVFVNMTGSYDRWWQPSWLQGH